MQVLFLLLIGNDVTFNPYQGLKSITRVLPNLMMMKLDPFQSLPRIKVNCKFHAGLSSGSSTAFQSLPRIKVNCKVFCEVAIANLHYFQSLPRIKVNCKNLRHDLSNPSLIFQSLPRIKVNCKVRVISQVSPCERFQSLPRIKVNCKIFTKNALTIKASTFNPYQGLKSIASDRLLHTQKLIILSIPTKD